MLKRTFPLPFVLFLLSAAACGGSGASPTAPGTSATPSAGGVAGGASITGSVTGGTASSLTGASSGHAISGLTVSVAGTSMSATVDPTGRFVLNGVPAGDVQLQFSGPVTATVPVAQVRPAETITMVISVSSTTVTVESQVRNSAGDEQIEGRIESLPPTMASNTVKVAGRTVRTDTSTIIRQGSATLTFTDLEIGYRVHVKGRTSGGSLLATSIDVQNVITTIPVNVNGVIDTLSGSAAAFQFQIGSRIVKGDTLTVFFGDGNTARTFANLVNGVRVEVKGQQRDGFIYAERIHINGNDDDDDDDDDQDSSASIQGKVISIGGSAPALTLTVGTTIVRTTSDTEVKRRGDTQTLAAVKVGQDVHVVGTRQPDGSITARRIELTDDATGGEVEIQGSAGGVGGACPALTFKINGYSISTTSSTVFEGMVCADLKSGTNVTVKGLSQADNSVVATRVKR